MSRMDLDAVGQVRHLGMYAVIKGTRKFALGGFSEQIWTAQRSNKKKVAGQECHGLPAAALFIDQKTQVLGGVAGRVDRHNTQVANHQFFAVFELIMGKLIGEFFALIVTAQP